MSTFSFSFRFFWLLLINLPDIHVSTKITCEPTLRGIETPVIDLPEFGSLFGSTTASYWKKRNIFQYLGIPFAEPPLGNLRFRPPEKLKKTHYTRYDASSYKRKCPQLANEEDDYYLSHATEPIEDCLHLNVFTPERKQNETKKLLPVMIFIHGGGLYQDSAIGLCPNYLLDFDVIFVSINYRLGPLGFLCLHTDNVPGNVGFLDQIMAIEWVNENIVYFGGDKNRVTLFGQSAGSLSINLFLLSPVVKAGLFQQVILQSGTIFSKDWYMDLDPIANARAYAKYLNCTQQNVNDLLDCLMKLPASELIRSNIRYMNDIVTSERTMAKNIGIGGAVIQKAGRKKFLVEYPVDTFRKGNFSKLPAIIGFTEHEGSFAFAVLYDFILNPEGVNGNCFQNNNCISEEYAKDDIFYDYLKFIARNEANLLELVKDIYFPKNVRGHLSAIAPGFIDLASNVMEKTTALEFARETYRKMSTYLYTFNYKGQYNEIDSYPFATGVAHSDDLMYLFQLKNRTLNDEDIKVAKIISSLWTSFAINNGKPKIETGSTNGTSWPRVSNRYGPYVIIDKNVRIKDDLTIEFHTQLK